jgi:hypothetical protein
MRMTEASNGFKETEIGPIPVDWDVVPLSQAAKHEKATINPQSHPDEVFGYYSIPAYQVSDEPALERSSEIRSQKLVVETDMVLFGKLNPRVPNLISKVKLMRMSLFLDWRSQKMPYPK